jgi:hypothetical protein
MSAKVFNVLDEDSSERTADSLARVLTVTHTDRPTIITPAMTKFVLVNIVLALVAIVFTSILFIVIQGYSGTRRSCRCPTHTNVN